MTFVSDKEKETAAEADALRREWHEHAVEVDTKLGELYEAHSTVMLRLSNHKLTLAHYAGANVEYATRTRREVRESAEELIGMILAKSEAGTFSTWHERDAREAVAKWETLKKEAAAIRMKMKPLEADFDAHGWSRFFLVKAHGGHIHASMNCSTCYVTTEYGWLPALSGLTEKDAVEAEGPLLCSVCFPTAPVEWTLGKPKVEKETCPGSGTHEHDSSGIRYMSPRARCNHCHVTVSVTSTGKMRAHKPAAAK